MKYIITENQYTRIRRRFDEVDELIKNLLVREFEKKVISFTCGAFEDEEEFLEWFSDEIFNKVFMKFYMGNNTSKEERDMLDEIIKQYVHDKHGERIKNEWTGWCFGKGYG